jgi:hypothetical protein
MSATRQGRAARLARGLHWRRDDLGSGQIFNRMFDANLLAFLPTMAPREFDRNSFPNGERSGTHAFPNRRARRAAGLPLKDGRMLLAGFSVGTHR